MSTSQKVIGAVTIASLIGVAYFSLKSAALIVTVVLKIAS